MDRDLLVAMLGANGFVARTASSGEEALKRLAESSSAGEPFDLVLMDCKMPGMDGIRATGLIKSDVGLSHIPAVFLVSAFEREALLAGAPDHARRTFLVKPVNEALLMDLIVGIFSPKTEGLATKSQPAPAPDTTGLTGRRVLLIEDNEFNCDLASELLSDLGISVTVAANGKEGIARLTAEQFDLVLMDIQMPVMDGLTATSVIRSNGRFRDLPIIAMTANAMNGDRERSLEAGMNDHLTKPINPETLTETLVRWMPIRRTMRPQQEVAVVRAPVEQDSLPGFLPPFDIQAALIRANGKPALLRKLMRRFHDQFASAGSDLRGHVDAGRTQDAQRLAHTLKSIAATLEARDLTVAAGAVEEAFRTGHTESLGSLIDAMEAALAPAIAAAGSVDLWMAAPRSA